MKNILIKIAKILLVIILGGAVGIASLHFLLLWSGHNFNPQFLEIDSCLDDGKSWNYEIDVCGVTNNKIPSPIAPIIIEEEITPPEPIEETSAAPETIEDESTKEPLTIITIEEQESHQKKNIFTINIGANLTPCVGMIEQECMIIQREGNAKWELFYDKIQGFNYEEGYTYTLRVEEVAIENVPADGSSVKWELQKVMEKQIAETIVTKVSPQQLCEEGYGKWIAEANECTYVSPEYCEETLGGKFNPCASACRNNPEAEVCTSQCVLVCEL